MEFYAIIIHICNMDKAGAIFKLMLYAIQHTYIYIYIYIYIYSLTYRNVEPKKK